MKRTVEARLDVALFCTVQLPEAWQTLISEGKVSIDNDHWYPTAVSADGSRVFGKFYSNAWSGVAAVDRQGSVTRLRTFDNPNEDQATAAFDGRWLVWEEDHSIENWNDWDIRAWDSSTGDVFDIASASRVNGVPVSGPFVIPVVSHGKAAWLQPNQAGKLEVHLYDLAKRQDRVVSEGDALLPVVFWDSRLLWGERFTENGQPAGHLVMIDAQTGKHLKVPEPLASIRSIGTMAASGDLVAWSEGSLVMAWRKGERKATEIFADPNSKVDWIRVAGDFVLWEGNVGSTVADTTTRSVAALGGDPRTNGQQLLLVRSVGPRLLSDETDQNRVSTWWQHFEGDVVDVSKLPPLPGCPS